MFAAAAGYRQLYKDALSSGQNSFVVTAADPDTGHLAAYGAGLRKASFQVLPSLAFVVASADELLFSCAILTPRCRAAH